MRPSVEMVFDACRVGDIDLVNKFVAGKAKRSHSSLSRLSSRLTARLSSSRASSSSSTTTTSSMALCDVRDVHSLTMAHTAAAHNHNHILGLLLGLDPALSIARDKRSCTPLHHAAWSGHYDCVSTLLHCHEEGLVDMPNNVGDTPLHLAANTVSARVVSALLHSGASVDTRNMRGETALDIAARLGRTAICRILVNHSPTLVMHAAAQSLADSASVVVYPLHMAAKNGHDDTCRMLVETGFDVDFVTEHGSALHVAAVHGRLDVVRLLLERGVSLELRDAHGHTCLETLAEHLDDHAKDITQVMQLTHRWTECRDAIREHEKRMSERAPVESTSYMNVIVDTQHSVEQSADHSVAVVDVPSPTSHDDVNVWHRLPTTSSRDTTGDGAASPTIHVSRVDNVMLSPVPTSSTVSPLVSVMTVSTGYDNMPESLCLDTSAADDDDDDLVVLDGDIDGDQEDLDDGALTRVGLDERAPLASPERMLTSVENVPPVKRVTIAEVNNNSPNEVSPPMKTSPPVPPKPKFVNCAMPSTTTTTSAIEVRLRESRESSPKSMTTSFNEANEWAHIEDIMSSFGGAVCRDSLFVESRVATYLRHRRSAALHVDFQRAGSVVDDGTVHAFLQQQCTTAIGTHAVDELAQLLHRHGYDRAEFLASTLLPEILLQIVPDLAQRDAVATAVESATCSPLPSLRDYVRTSDWLTALHVPMYAARFETEMATTEEVERRGFTVDTVIELVPSAPIGHVMRVVESAHSGVLTRVDDDERITQPVECQSTSSVDAAPSSPTYTEASSSEQLWYHPPEKLLASHGVTYACHYLGSSEWSLDAALNEEENYAAQLVWTRSTMHRLKEGVRDMSKVSLVNMRVTCRLVCLVDSVSRLTASEHAVDDIHRVVQDDRDLNCFAFVTHDERHVLCHVFCTLTADLATEVILTLGQAFEMAYQLMQKEVDETVTI